MAQCVQRNVRPAVGSLDHGGDHVRDLGRVDDHPRAERASKPELVFGDVDRHDVRTHGVSDHDGGEADAAATVHGDPFTG